jgi:hypothetical protein
MHLVRGSSDSRAKDWPRVLPESSGQLQRVNRRSCGGCGCGTEWLATRSSHVPAEEVMQERRQLELRESDPGNPVGPSREATIIRGQAFERSGLRRSDLQAPTQNLGRVRGCDLVSLELVLSVNFQKAARRQP